MEPIILRRKFCFVITRTTFARQSILYKNHKLYENCEIVKIERFINVNGESKNVTERKRTCE